jgi:cytosine/adenosine deaminase-related metal-dependent hydrolase
MIIKASHAILEPGRVLRDVRVETAGPVIDSITSGPSPFHALPDMDFGEAVITPGLVNPHAHLELEFCSGRTPFDGSFVGWLQRIRDLKRDNGGATIFPEDSLAQLARAGCTTVVDHHTGEMEWKQIADAGLRHVPLREFFEFNNHGPDVDAMRKLAYGGYAAHSTYTTSPEVAQACRSLSDDAGLPLSIHLSEFPGELEFIRDGSNEAVEELLRRAEAVDPAWRGSGTSPVQYVAELGLLNSPCYTIHVNYVEPGDLDVLAQLKPTVVFCPRSHAYFGHPRHPLQQLIAAGVPVALGTDSLASNDALSPLHEAALARQSFPDVPAETIFRAITTAALAPLGWDSRLGRLHPGCGADLAVFQLDGNPGSGFDRVFDAVIAQGESALTVCGGKATHADEKYLKRAAASALAG